MENLSLSKKALDLLEDNGYHFSSKNDIITIKHSSGVMGIVVLGIITLFLSIPLFSAGIIYGVGLFILVIGFVVIRRVFFSAKSKLVINTIDNTFSMKAGTYFEEDQPLTMISSISLKSSFIDKYVTAARNEMEEHLIEIKVELISKEKLTVFKLKSDQSEPTDEINEVFNLIENAVKEAKKA